MNDNNKITSILSKQDFEAVKNNILVNPNDWIVVKNLGIPPRVRRGSKYPITDLQVGDGLIATTKRHARNIAVAARNFAKRNSGWRFFTRTLKDGRVAIVRSA